MTATITPVPPAAPAETSVTPARRERWRPVLAWAAVVGSFVALGMVADLRALLDGVTHVLPTGNGQDPIQEAWFLAVTPRALLAGHSPLITHLLNVPRPVNLLDNPSLLLPGALLAPVTLAAGPVASFNVAVVLAFATSATAATVVLRRWVSWLPAAYVGGLLFGFSPYMVAQTQGHLNLAFVAVIPLLLAALDELVVRQRWNPFGVGAVLGALGVAQFFTSVEMLVDTAVVAAIGLLFLVVARPHEVARRARHVASGLAIGFGVFAVVVAYPATIALTGEGHTKGPIQAGLGRLSNDLVSPVATTPLQLFHTGSVGATLVGGDLYENGGALGILLLIALALVAIKLWREPVIRFAVAMAVCAFVLSLGVHLAIGGTRTAIPLPYALLAHWTVFAEAVPARYDVFVDLFAALVLAVGADRAHLGLLGSRRPGTRTDLLVLGVVGLCLLPLVPAFPFRTSSVSVPAVFDPPRASIAAGSVVLAYPEAFQDHDQAMLWQAEAAMSFRMPGGYVIVAQPDGSASFAKPDTLLEALLEECWLGVPLPKLGTHGLTIIRAQLAAWDVRTVVVAHEGARPASAVQLLTVVLGRAPSMVGTTAVWSLRGHGAVGPPR